MSRYAFVLNLHPGGAEALPQARAILARHQARAILATHGFTDGPGGLFVGDDPVAAETAAQEIARAVDIGAGSMGLLEFGPVSDLFDMVERRRAGAKCDD